MATTEIATKFVAWEVPALETLQGSKVYMLRQKVSDREPLSREEKDWITEQVGKSTQSSPLNSQ